MQENRGLIFHSTDRTSEVNNRFTIYLFNEFIERSTYVLYQVQR
jgi:hypothetical protein